MQENLIYLHVYTKLLTLTFHDCEIFRLKHVLSESTHVIEYLLFALEKIKPIANISSICALGILVIR